MLKKTGVARVESESVFGQHNRQEGRAIGERLRCPLRLDMTKFKTIRQVRESEMTPSQRLQQQMNRLQQEAPLGQYRDRFFNLRALNGLIITVDEMDEVLRAFLTSALLKAHEIPERDKVKPKEMASSEAMSTAMIVFPHQSVCRSDVNFSSGFSPL
mgnify:FL=1